MVVMMDCSFQYIRQSAPCRTMSPDRLNIADDGSTQDFVLDFWGVEYDPIAPDLTQNGKARLVLLGGYVSQT